MSPDQTQLVEEFPGQVLNPSHHDLANAIRFLAADAVQAAVSGHPGMPMGMADVATVLFTKFMKFDPSAPDWADRDRFVLSAGHGSMLLYSLLHLTGYEDITLDEIRNFRQLGSTTAGHPEYGLAAGIEATTGPLGQGLAMAVGMALAERMQNARFGDDLVDHFTYVISGDGCLMEGVSHEAISLAGHLKLSKLVLFFDDNGITIDGETTLSVSDDQLARFAACGWHVAAIDGHDPDAITDAIDAARRSDKPSMIACKTIIGFGAPTKQGTSGVHGAALGDDEIAAARKALGWNYGPFKVPDPVRSAWLEAGNRCTAERRAWEGRLAPSDQRDEFTRMNEGRLPDGWLDAVEDFKKSVTDEAPSWATRKSSGEILNLLANAIPEMIGGSADLAGSNLTKVKDANVIDAAGYDGNYINYGVREFAMAAAMNGLALHGGYVPFGGTFLVFADYMRPAIRLSAIMGLRVGYVMTHDSIGVGEDGPTHQPVETLASLRAMPNVNVFRPADSVETAECWALTLENENGPSILALTRQDLPPVRTEYTAENLSAKGAYVLADAEGGARKVTLLATGSEVSLALKARDDLQNDGVPTAVVSMPCWELFDVQDDSYRAGVLGDGTVRVAAEAAISMGWDKYIGPDGGFVGMTGFGASAPGGDLFKHFEITAESIVAAVRKRL